MAEKIDQITTSFLLSNLHCPSCVSAIQDVVLSLKPRPASVSPSLVTSLVTVVHNQALPTAKIRNVLEDAGFEVCDDHNSSARFPQGLDGQTGYLDKFIHVLTTGRDIDARPKRTRHIDNCDSCRLEAEPSKPCSDNQRSQKPGAEMAIQQPSIVIDSAQQEVWRASVAIGGMTCAGCANTIVDVLKQQHWVENVVVNLISSSATIDFIGEDHKNDLVQSIDNMGYTAVLDSVSQLSKIEAQSSERTVEVLVDGMFCESCPERVLAALDVFGPGLRVDTALTVHEPILKITYVPESSRLTIRDVIGAISAADKSFRPKIYHPPTLEERSKRIHAREQFRILLRVTLTLVIAIPTLIIGIVFMSLVSSDNKVRELLMTTIIGDVSRSQVALFAMATPVYFLCADVFHLRALKEVRNMWRRNSKTPLLQRFYRFGSMNMLMSLGTSIAYFSSLARLIIDANHHSGMSNEELFYFDSVVFLTLFLLTGRLIEAYSKSKTGDAVAMLGKLRPTEALLVLNAGSDSGEETSTGDTRDSDTKVEHVEKINVDLLEFGDIVRVLHGGSPPCDGTVIKGESKFDESSLTGESRLIKKMFNDQVFSGTVNKGDSISIKITGVAGSSMLDQIVKAVREGQTRRAPMERVADTLTGFFVPCVTLLAIGTWITWLSLGVSGTLPESWMGHASGSWVEWSLQFAIAVFVVACPCGLALAAPTALFVGGGIAAQHGILAKGGGEAFEKASNLDCIVFDKTGTLTKGGEPVITDFEILETALKPECGDAIDETMILSMVKSLEEHSSHTIAKALTSFCAERRANLLDVTEIEEVAGRGMKGCFKLSESVASPQRRATIIIGNEQLIADFDVEVASETRARLDQWKTEGRSVALAAVKLDRLDSKSIDSSQWKLEATFAISDPIRQEAPNTISALQKMGLEVWMLSGDNQTTANAIGSQVGIPSCNVIAGVLPSEKAEKIRYLQKSLKSRGSRGEEHEQRRAMIAMVGDGINDSPALTTADIGVAIGSGSDIAISSAEFVLVSSNLTSLITLLDLSRVVFRRIKFNFGWALIYNLVALPVAAGVLYPIVSHGKHVRLDPVWASLAMALSSISVVCSSLALRSRIPGIGFRVSHQTSDSN